MTWIMFVEDELSNAMGETKIKLCWLFKLKQGNIGVVAFISWCLSEVHLK